MCRHNIIFILFDVVVFLLSRLVTIPGFMSISWLVPEFLFVKDWPKIWKSEKNLFCILPNIWRLGQVSDTKFGTNIYRGGKFS